MWDLPTQFFMTTGVGESFTSLNAFDNALLDAGIANYNHIKLSSIIPPKAVLLDRAKAILPIEGSLLPGVLADCRGKKGEFIIASLVLAYNKDKNLPGLIFELLGKDVEVFQITSLILSMAEEGMRKRNWKIEDLHVFESHLEIKEAFGCAIVSATMLP